MSYFHGSNESGSQAKGAFVICTRDRPFSLSVLLDDLAKVFRQSKLPNSFDRLLVVNDCTRRDTFLETEKLCQIRSGDLVVSTLSESSRIGVLSFLRHAAPSIAEILDEAPALGEGPWNLAKARLVAILMLLFGEEFSDYHQFIFLDDDIRWRPTRLGGFQLEANPDRIFRELLWGFPFDRPHARGTSYIGRADACQLLHLDHCLEEIEGRLIPPEEVLRIRSGLFLCRATLSKAPVTLDVDSPGISGAVLSTNRNSLERIPLRPLYNEDWIWLRELQLEGGSLLTCSEPLIHAGELDVALDPGKLFFQLEGTIVHRVLAKRVADLPSLQPFGSFVPVQEEILAIVRDELDYLGRLARRCRTASISRVRADPLRNALTEFSLKLESVAQLPVVPLTVRMQGLFKRHRGSALKWRRAVAKSKVKVGAPYLREPSL